MADKSINTENDYEVLKDGYYVYFDKDIWAKNQRWIFCDKVKGITDGKDFFSRNDFTIQAVHVFKNEKDAQNFIDEDAQIFLERGGISLEDTVGLKIARIPNTLGKWYESKKSARKSIKESADDIITVKEFCFWGHGGNIVEIWTIDGVLCDSFEVRNVGKSEYKNYEIHGWDCAKNTVIIYIKK